MSDIDIDMPWPGGGVLRVPAELAEQINFVQFPQRTWFLLDQLTELAYSEFRDVPARKLVDAVVPDDLLDEVDRCASFVLELLAQDDIAGVITSCPLLRETEVDGSCDYWQWAEHSVHSAIAGRLYRWWCDVHTERGDADLSALRMEYTSTPPEIIEAWRSQRLVVSDS